MAIDIVAQFEPMVQFLSGTLGPDYEIVLCRVTGKQGIIAIANGHVSGRSIGAPISGLANQMIEDKYYVDHDYKLNYRGISSTGKILRSSTYFIKDSKNHLLGMLCINFDDSRYHELSEKVFRLCHPDDYVSSTISINFSPNTGEGSDEYGLESFYESVSAAIEAAIAAVTGNPDQAKEPGRLSQDAKIKIIRRLENEGIFALKGTIPVASEKIGCSPASIYRYIAQVRNES